MSRYELTVRELREIAENILEQLEGMDDNMEISTRCNTYGMRNTILETDAGFIDYADIKVIRHIDELARKVQGILEEDEDHDFDFGPGEVEASIEELMDDYGYTYDNSSDPERVAKKLIEVWEVD